MSTTQHCVLQREASPVIVSMWLIHKKVDTIATFIHMCVKVLDEILQLLIFYEQGPNQHVLVLSWWKQQHTMIPTLSLNFPCGPKHTILLGQYVLWGAQYCWSKSTTNIHRWAAEQQCRYIHSSPKWNVATVQKPWHVHVQLVTHGRAWNKSKTMPGLEIHRYIDLQARYFGSHGCGFVPPGKAEL
jgi:hypothetical protein